MDLSHIKNPDTLNIFCDASIQNLRNRKFRGCYGAIAVFMDQPIDEVYKVCNNTTNNNSEIKAIRASVCLALKHRGKFNNINIFSDSQISISGIRDRIFRWNVINDSLCGYNDNPIANESVFIEVLGIITSSELRVNFYHQKGHVNIDKKDDILHAGEVFKRTNNLDKVSNSFIKYISYWNNEVDNKSRQILYELHLKNQNNDPIMFYPTDNFYSQLDTYRRLKQ